MLIAEHAATRFEDNGDAVGCADRTTAPGNDSDGSPAGSSTGSVGDTVTICERIRCAKKSMRSRAVKKI